MLFDKTKIQTIEATISEIFRSFPIDNRCAKIVYSPCFKSLFFEARTRNFFSKKYKVYSINQILESVHTKKETTLSEKIIGKIGSAALGFLPIIGSYLSVVILLGEITKDVIDEKSINDIEKRLNRSWKKHKKHKKTKYIIYVEDTSALSMQELTCLQILSFLISQNYIVNAALLLAQPSNQELPYINNCIKIDEFIDEDILDDNADRANISVRNSLTILNVIGLDYIDKLNVVMSKRSTPDKTIEAIVNCIFREKQIELDDELDVFLNSCSLLFEEFELKDVEFISLLQKNEDYQHLFTLAQKAEVIQGINLQKFYFLQPFLREFFQQRKYTFPSEFYNSVYSYLENKYPNFYEDLAIASAMLLSNDDIILSKNIIAYYHSAYSMPGYKLAKVKETLESYPLGETILKLDKLYNESNCNSEYLKSICLHTIQTLKSSNLSGESKLVALSFVTRLYYELDIEQKYLVEISKYYRSQLSSIKIFSNAFSENWNYALDYIAFSTCIEDDYPTHHTVQKLVASIQRMDASSLQREKYLKYLRLGNAIYPHETRKAKELLLKGYEISNGSNYIHMLFGINYSVALILEGQYKEAITILEPIIKLSYKNTAVNMSAQNNYSIAKYLSKQSNTAKSLKTINKYCNISRQSDYCICINNYISLKIMSGNKELRDDAEVCAEIVNMNDKYHSFYARHNIMVIYFLTKDIKFWEITNNTSVPYLLKHYEPLFLEKIKFLKENFEKDWNINQLTIALQIYLNNNGFADISHFNSLPVLFGLIERWFE